MLVWSTEFPVLPNCSDDALFDVCQKWLVGSPHLDWLDSDIPKVAINEITSASKGVHRLSLGQTCINGETFYGFRHQWQDAERRDWVTEICGWRTSGRFLVGVHLHCSTSDTGIPLPQPKRPYIVKQLLEEIGGDIDGEFPVCSQPRQLAESEIDIAARLLRGETDHCLPVIYASSTWENRPFLDCQKLAQRFAGIAHVVTEPSRRFSFILANRVDRTNPYEGALSICWPHGGGRATRLFPYNYNDHEEYEGAIADTIRIALAGRRPDHHCTWDYLRELIARQKIETLRREGKAGLDEYIKAFDEEQKLTKNRLEEAENEIGRLKADLANRSRGSGIYSEGLLAPSSESDLFAGEQRDVLVRALTVAFNNVQPGGRARDVLQALIKANPSTGESRRIEDEIRKVLEGCSNVGKKERRALEELGFSISEDGKHLKLIFRGDDRYTFAMAKTGSDIRGMKNWISDVTKRLFK